jgi:hypothetical protein
MKAYFPIRRGPSLVVDDRSRGFFECLNRLVTSWCSGRRVAGVGGRRCRPGLAWTPRLRRARRSGSTRAADRADEHPPGGWLGRQLPGAGPAAASVGFGGCPRTGKAYVILDGTLLRIDRVGMTGGRDRPNYSGCEDQRTLAHNRGCTSKVLLYLAFCVLSKHSSFPLVAGHFRLSGRRHAGPLMKSRGCTKDLGQGLSNQRGSVLCRNIVGGSARSFGRRRCRW